MGKAEKPTKNKKKKELVTSINAKLESALFDFKIGMGEKEFNKALKKASKLLGSLLYVKKKKDKEKKEEKKNKNKVPVITTKNTGQ